LWNASLHGMQSPTFVARKLPCKEVLPRQQTSATTEPIHPPTTTAEEEMNSWWVQCFKSDPSRQWHQDSSFTVLFFHL